MKFKKIIICGILSFILCFSCVLMPKADINSVGSTLLNDNNIPYAFTLNESTPSATVSELTSGVGFYLNYLDYLNFYSYARLLTYTSDIYILFDYTIYDYDLNQWQITCTINRTFNLQNDYDYSLNFTYNLPTLNTGTDTLINIEGINTSSILYGLVDDFISSNNISFEDVNIFKLLATRLFSQNQGYLYTVDIEFSPININSLGTENYILKNFISSQPFTQNIPDEPDEPDQPDNSYIIYTNEWEAMTWSGLTSFSGNNIWKNGNDIYYSYGTKQYKLNGTTWTQMTWSGLTDFDGRYVWSDGTSCYYSNGQKQYKLNGTTWTQMTWGGYNAISGDFIWKNGNDIYYSNSSRQYMLIGTIWADMTWSGLTSFSGNNIWSNGTDIYFSSSSNHFKLNGTTWTQMTWSGLTSFSGSNVWSNGDDVFYSASSNQYILNGTTWEPMIWVGMTTFYANQIWQYGNDIYCSNGRNQAKLKYEIIPNVYFYGFNNEIIETRRVSSDYVWKNVNVVGSNMPILDNTGPYHFVEWEYSRDLGDLVHNEFLSITQSDENIYFYPKFINTTLNGTYTSNGYFTLGRDGEDPIQPFNTDFNFISNGQSFSRMKFSFTDNTFYLYYDNVLVAYQSRTSSDFIHWTNLKYSNIIFDNSYPQDFNAYYFIIRNFYLGSISVSDVSGYYYFNENPIGTSSNNNTFRFLFISNGELFNSLTILSNGAILYDGEMVYNGDTQTWVNDKFRLININNTQIEEEQMQILLSNGVFSYIDVNGDYGFSDVLFSVADIPVRIMSQLLDVSIFGVSLFTALCGIITILLVAFVIKKFL